MILCYCFSFCVFSLDSYSFACESYFGFARVVSNICDVCVIHDKVGTSVGGYLIIIINRIKEIPILSN
jgi:hypothetical protein